MNPDIKAPLSSGLKWMMLGRLIFLIFATTSEIIKNIDSLSFPPEPMGIYLTLIIAALINLVYLILSYRIKNLFAFAQVQISMDITITSILVYLSGGLQGSFVLFYIPSIMAAAILLGRRASLIYPTISIFMLSFHVLAYKQGFYEELHLDPTWALGYERNFAAIMASLLTQSTAFYLIAILSSYLSRGLKEARFLGGEYAEITPDALVVYDLQGKILSCNSNFSTLCASSSSELIGELMGNAPEPCPEIYTFFKKENPSTSLNLELRHANKNTPFEATALSLFGIAHLKQGTIIKLSNLSNYQETQKLRERNQGLELVREMSASIAHEIRNPLAAMRGAAAEINTHLQDEQDKTLMNILLREVDRLDQTVGNFMDMARMNPPRLRRIDLRHLIEDSVAMLKQNPEATDKTINLTLTGELMIESDADHITQILINLGKNALQAMQPGNTYAINAHDIKDNWISIELTDTGCGIDEAIQKKIFSPFFSTKSTGSGLGLPMVAQLTEALGGSISVQSKPGTTVFSLLLPKSTRKNM